MLKPTRSSALRYGLAVATVGLALFVTLQIEPLVNGTPFPLFFAAVMISTWYGGRNPGLLSIALSAMVSDYFFIPPLYSLMPGRDSILQISEFILVALLINWLAAAHQHSEKSQRESEELYRDLFEHAPIGIYRTTPDGTILIANPTLVRLLGYSSFAELAAKNIEEEEPNATYPRSRFKVDLEREGELRGLESGWKKRDGSVVFLRENAKVIRDEDGRVLYYEGTIEDISERKQAEDALRESEEKLRQSQRLEAIGQLAGGIAHDFNNLLTIISGNAELSLAKLAPDAPIQQRLVEIEKAADRAATLTRQLLAFSRRQQLERKSINLNDTIHEIMKLLRRVIGADVEVSFHAAANLASVFADPSQVEQVVMNLAINARDAMAQGGRLIIETHVVTLDQTYLHNHPQAQPGRYAQINVSDTGTGMDDETKTHIFEPFFTTKAVGKGTGLGLAMVYGIVKQHDGLIEVYSEVGQGTTFKIYLPVAEQTAAVETQQAQAPLRGGAETILLAEDEEPLGELARSVLEELGYTVLLARDGEEAVNIYADNHEQIELVILDVVMPRMGGYEAYKAIRLSGSEVPVLFMTGYSAEMVQSQFIEQSGIPLLQKPYSVEVFGRKVREILDSVAEETRGNRSTTTP